jgi:ATP-dependent protease ClpP protease subunit
VSQSCMSRNPVHVNVWSTDDHISGTTCTKKENTAQSTESTLRMSVEEELAHLHVGREIGLVATLLKECRTQFAGHYVRSPSDIQQIVREVALPRWVVPMCAEFRRPYTDDFIRGLDDAMEYIRRSDIVNCKQQDGDCAIQSEHMILVPINSPGGNTDNLRQILTYFETIRAATTPTSRVKIVTYGFGMVASCAFVLYQGGDLCLAADNADFMCHEPAISASGPFNLNSNNADRTAHSLHELKTEIYSSAERHLYDRCCMQDESLYKWRARWYAQHTQDGSIVAFARSVRDYTEDIAPAFAVEVYDVFDYLVKEVATNVSDQIITADWMLKLGLCEEAGVDVRMGTLETISLHRLPAFQFRK